MCINISKITINIHDKEIALTLNELYELRNKINDLIGTPLAPSVPSYPPTYPYPWITYTYHTDTRGTA